MAHIRNIPEMMDSPLFRKPQKDDRAVQADPHSSKTDVSLSFCSDDPGLAYLHGYRTAAAVAVDHFRQSGWDQRFLVYPIIFLYRHYVELMLKRLIDKSDSEGVRKSLDLLRLDDRSQKKLSHCHDLQWLWERVSPIVEYLQKRGVPEEDIEGIKSLILQLADLSQKSTEARYPNEAERLGGRSGSEEDPPAILGIDNFSQNMERLANYLEGVDSCMADMIDTYHQMSSDYYDMQY